MVAAAKNVVSHPSPMDERPPGQLCEGHINHRGAIAHRKGRDGADIFKPETKRRDESLKRRSMGITGDRAP